MKILIVGMGSIGRRHLNIVKNNGEHEIVICDSNEETIKEIAEENGIGEFYFDYKEALNENINAVIICTPNSLHAPVCIAAFSKGCSVLVEKPIAHKTEDAEKMILAARESGKPLVVGYILRYFPGMEEIKEIIEGGILGRIASARVKVSGGEALSFAKSQFRRFYETGGGIIYDYSHEIDYLRYFFGEAKRYVCFKDLLIKHGSTCDDIAEIIIQFEGGVIANIHMDYVRDSLNGGGRRIEIIGEKGTIDYDFNGRLVISTDDGTVTKKRYVIDRDRIFLNQFLDFIEISNGKDLKYVNGEDGIAVLKICEGLYMSDAEGVVQRT